MRISEERGSALIDFLGFGLLLQIPILLLATQIFTIQSNQLAADSIARHSLRSFLLHEIPVEITAHEIAKDFGLTIEPSVQLTCKPDCTNPESILRIDVAVGAVRSNSTMIR